MLLWPGPERSTTVLYPAGPNVATGPPIAVGGRRRHRKTLTAIVVEDEAEGRAEAAVYQPFPTDDGGHAKLPIDGH